MANLRESLTLSESFTQLGLDKSRLHRGIAVSCREDSSIRVDHKTINYELWMLGSLLTPPAL